MNQDNKPRILVAGIGNIFLGDDAFGVEVAQRLLHRPIPEGVRVVDFGIRGLDLVYALLDGYESVLLIDAVPRGEAPGTLCVMELPPLEAVEGAGVPMEGHSMDLVKVLRQAAALGARVERLLLVGCEPTPPGGEDDMRMELSEPVQAAVAEAVGMVERLVQRLLRGDSVAVK